MAEILRDSMGEMSVPDGALYGAQTARAVENFPISGWTMPAPFLRALAQIKQAAATVNMNAERLDESVGEAIIQAAREVIEGQHADQFPVDVFQTGSGTSTNMNVNEVIARRASEILGQPGAVHPNDHVNMGQSSNDVIPTAMHVAAAVEIHDRLLPAARALHEALLKKAAELDDVVKIGRTHLMDAVPVRLGQEVCGWAGQVAAAVAQLQRAMTDLCELPIGGTAVGTGLNAPAGLPGDICLFLAEENRLPFAETENHFAQAGARDIAVAASAALRGYALAMGKIASDIRLLGSGPRCGLGELQLPILQPGSSIMPGKVNPVMCESVVQVACQVVGCDAAIVAGATGGVGGILYLNVAVPLIANNLLTQIQLLANVSALFDAKCVAGLQANTERCAELVEQSLAMVTSLAPVIGYDAAADIAKTACAENKTIRQVCLEKNVLPENRLAELLDALEQTGS